MPYHTAEGSICPEARDLIHRLICDPENRLGGREGTARDIKRHPFFASVIWEQYTGPRDAITIKAPYVPYIGPNWGLSNFDSFENEGDDEDLDNLDLQNGNGGFNAGANNNRNKNYVGGKDYFAEFTFRRFFDNTGHPVPFRMIDGVGGGNMGGLRQQNHEATGSNAQAPPVPDPVYV